MPSDSRKTASVPRSPYLTYVLILVISQLTAWSQTRGTHIEPEVNKPTLARGFSFRTVVTNTGDILSSILLDIILLWLRVILYYVQTISHYSPNELKKIGSFSQNVDFRSLS